MRAVPKATKLAMLNAFSYQAGSMGPNVINIMFVKDNLVPIGFEIHHSPAPISGSTQRSSYPIAHAMQL